MSSGSLGGTQTVGFEDDVVEDDGPLDDFEDQEGPPEWNRVDFTSGSRQASASRAGPRIRADHAPPRLKPGYNPSRRSLHEPVRPKPPVRTRPQSSHNVFLFTQSAKEEPSKARVQSAGATRVRDKPIKLHTELATPEGLAAMLGQKPRPPTAGVRRNGPHSRQQRPRPHTAHFAGSRVITRPLSSSTDSSQLSGLPRSATTLGGSRSRREPSTPLVIDDDSDSNEDNVPMNQYLTKLHAVDAAQIAVGGGAMAARKRALAMKRAGQTDPLMATFAAHRGRTSMGPYAVRGNAERPGTSHVDIETLETVRLGTERVDDPLIGLPMLSDLDTAASSRRPPRARLHDDPSRGQVKRDDTYEGFLDSIIESGQDRATVIDRILTKPKKHLSTKKLRAQVAKTRAKQREKGWNDNTSKKDTHRPHNGVTKEYDSLTDPYCSVVENPKLLRRLKKDGQITADAQLLLKKRIQRKKRVDEPVVQEVLHQMQYKNERIPQVDGRHPPGHEPVDWANQKLFENFNPAPFEGNDTSQVRIACERVASQLEDLWELLDFPENIRRQFRKANMTEATVGTYASMLSHLTQLLLERDSIRAIVNLLTERETLVAELAYSRDEIELGHEVDQDVEDIEAALREYTKEIKSKIHKWITARPWNKVFVYRGRDILQALPGQGAGTAAHCTPIVSDEAIKAYEDRIAYEKKIGVLTSRGKGKGKGGKKKGKLAKAARQKALANKAFNAGKNQVSEQAAARAAYVAEQYADLAVAAAFIDEDGDGLDDRFGTRPASRSLMLHTDGDGGYRSDSAMSGESEFGRSRIHPPSRLATPLSLSDDRSLATDITSPLSLSHDPSQQNSPLAHVDNDDDDDHWSPTARDRAIHAARLVINDIHKQALAMKRGK